MEQVYASDVPSIVKFGETIGPSIGIAIMLALIPLIIVYKRHNADDFICFILINLMIIIPLAILFFSQFRVYAQQCAAARDVAGINNTIEYSTFNISCNINVGGLSINSTYFAQNIFSSLSYNDQIYVYGNYTNYYTMEPPAPAISFTQNFIPWTPTIRNYDKGGAGSLGNILLIILCYLYLSEYFLILLISLGYVKEHVAGNIEMQPPLYSESGV